MLTRSPTPAPTVAPNPTPTAFPTHVPAVQGTGVQTAAMSSTQLIYYSTPSTWHTARAACLQEGGDLVSIHNHGENKAVVSFMDRFGGSSNRAWIGGNDIAQEVSVHV